MSAFSFLFALGDFFLLRKAEGTVRAYTEPQRAAVSAHQVAGERRRRAAARLVDPLPSALLLRASILSYLRASALAGDARLSDQALSPTGLAERLPPVRPDSLGPRSAEDTARVLAAVRSSDPLYFDRLDREELERVRAALERSARALRGATESRSLTYLKGERFGRIAGTLLLVGFLAYRAVTQTLWPDLAYEKPVLASSLAYGDPARLVNGDVGTSYAVGTASQDSPWLAVDLQGVYAIDTIRIYNRVDGWFDEALPLVVRTSIDGVVWDDIARRDTTFGYAPPWTVEPRHRRARFVRVQSLGKCIFALSALKVFGKK